MATMRCNFESFLVQCLHCYNWKEVPHELCRYSLTSLETAVQRVCLELREANTHCSTVYKLVSKVLIRIFFLDDGITHQLIWYTLTLSSSSPQSLFTHSLPTTNYTTHTIYSLLKINTPSLFLSFDRLSFTDHISPPPPILPCPLPAIITPSTPSPHSSSSSPPLRLYTPSS